MTFTQEIGGGLSHKARNRLYVRSAGNKQIFIFHCSQNKKKSPVKK